MNEVCYFLKPKVEPEMILQTLTIFDFVLCYCWSSYILYRTCSKVAKLTVLHRFILARVGYRAGYFLKMKEPGNVVTACSTKFCSVGVHLHYVVLSGFDFICI